MSGMPGGSNDDVVFGKQQFSQLLLVPQQLSHGRCVALSFKSVREQ